MANDNSGGWNPRDDRAAVVAGALKSDPRNPYNNAGPQVRAEVRGPQTASQNWEVHSDDNGKWNNNNITTNVDKAGQSAYRRGGGDEALQSGNSKDYGKSIRMGYAAGEGMMRKNQAKSDVSETYGSQRFAKGNTPLDIKGVQDNISMSDTIKNATTIPKGASMKSVGKAGPVGEALAAGAAVGSALYEKNAASILDTAQASKEAFDAWHSTNYGTDKY